MKKASIRKVGKRMVVMSGIAAGAAALAAFYVQVSDPLMSVPDDWVRVYLADGCAPSAVLMEEMDAFRGNFPVPVALIPFELGETGTAACQFTRDNLVANGAWWLKLTPHRWGCIRMVEEGRAFQDEADQVGWPTLVEGDGLMIVGFDEEMRSRLGLAPRET